MDHVPEHLEAAIQDRLRTHQTYGLALCAFDRTRVLFSGGVGYADVASGRPVTSETGFRAASVSKLLTATLILTIADRELIDLTDPVNDHLPSALGITGLDGGPASSTIRSLLSHSSGLPAGLRGIRVGNRALDYLSNGGRVPDLAASIAGLKLTNEPGGQIVYSNPAYNVLGYVAAQAVGGPFEEVVDDLVLGPLGMTGSTFGRPDPDANVATPYGSILPPKVGTEPADALHLVATPMGGLTTNVEDLARFGQMILGGTPGNDLLKPETVDAATSVQVTNHVGLEHGYGSGFKVRSWRGRTIVGHDGNMPGVATRLVLSPADGLGVVALTNGFALSVPHEVTNLALEHLLGLAQEPVPGSPQVPADATATDDEGFADRAQGTYRLRDGSPPGVIGRLNDLSVRVRVTHEARGRLRVDGHPGSGGPVWLWPDSAPGRYRVTAGVDNGTTAIIEERPDGWHLWLGFANHLHRSN